MKKLFKKRNLSQTDIFHEYSNLEKKNEQKLFAKLICSIKDNTYNSKNIKLKHNQINNYHESKSMNNRNIKINNLKSNINLSKEYNNFCGSFLYPDYNFATGKKVLKYLKTNGVEKTIFKQLEYISLKNEDKSFILFSDVDIYFNNLSFQHQYFHNNFSIYSFLF